MNIEFKPMAEDELAEEMLRVSERLCRRVDIVVLHIDGARVGAVSELDREAECNRFYAVINLSVGVTGVWNLMQGFGDTQLEAVQKAFSDSLRDGSRYVSMVRQLAAKAEVELPVEPVLMSAENPGGHTLEGLLAQLQTEVSAKNQKIVVDESDLSRAVQANNQRIIRYLNLAEAAQRDSYARLAEKAPDDGPEGVARIGGDVCELCHGRGPTVKHGGKNICSVCEVADVSAHSRAGA